MQGRATPDDKKRLAKGTVPDFIFRAKPHFRAKAHDAQKERRSLGCEGPGSLDGERSVAVSSNRDPVPGASMPLWPLSIARFCGCPRGIAAVHAPRPSSAAALN